MIKRLKISLNVLLTVFIVLTLSFSVTLVGISVYKNQYIYNSLVEEIEDDASSVDDYLFDVFYNVALYKNSIFNSGNLADFKNNADKQDFLLELEQNNQLNPDLYYDVALVYENQYYTVNHEPFYLDSNALAKFDEENVFVILNKYQYNDDYALVVGVKNDDIYSLFYLKELAISSYLALSYENSLSIITYQEGVLVSTNNEVISLTTANLDLSKKEIVVDGIKYIVISNNFEASNYFQEGLTIVTLISYDQIYRLIDIVQILMIVFLLIVSILVGIISYVMVKRIVEPLNALSTEMRNIDLDKKYQVTDHHERENNEIYILEKSYQSMIMRIQDLMRRQQEDNETQRQLELDSLQMQVNPHFLYNSLDMIAWMSKIANNKNIEEFVILLARFYRLSLHKGAKYIKVSEEIDIIKYYLDIQAKVFPDLFTYKIQIDPQIADYLSLKLILQPFVENIIKYAFYGIAHKGQVKISAREVGDNIVFEINDNGCGFDINIFKELSESKNGFGVKNVRERLNLEYGNKADLLIESTVGIGTIVKVTIPKHL